MKMPNKEQLVTIQLIVAGVILALFLTSVFLIEGYYLVYLLIPLLIANIILIYLSKTKGLVLNALMLFLSPSLFFFLIEFLASIIGALISLVHFIKNLIAYLKRSKK
jgi:hypothetical protein